MRSCTNEEPRYFGTKNCQVNANASTIQTMGVYMPPRVPLLVSRCRPSKRVSRREACKQSAMPTDWEACEQAAAQAHREVSPLTRLYRPPLSQLPPLLMVLAPQYRHHLLFSSRFSCCLPPTSLT